MYQVTIIGNKKTISYRCAGPVGAAKEGARVKATQQAIHLGNDIRIRLTPIDIIVQSEEPQWKP